jgi:ABC-type glycerol-3-phosphate transport system permease component
MRWRPGPFVLSLLIALMVVPPIVLVIPLFQLVVDLGQVSTYRSVIAIYTGILLPFSTFLLVSFFRTTPRELLEAARIDGAGHWRIWRSIVLPLAIPALVTVATVQALWVWNEVLIAVVFLQSEELRTLMVGITLFQSRFTLNIPLVMAGMVWATIPMVALYLLGQRFFIRGLTAGAVKG